MLYNYQHICELIKQYLDDHADEYFYPTDISKALQLTDYVVKRALKIINSNQIMSYTAETLVYVTSGGKEKQVPESYVSKFVEKGWTLGRCEESKRAISIAEGGDPDRVPLVWINNGVDSKQVEIVLIDQWLDNGWKRGKLRKPTTLGKIAIHKDGVDRYISEQDLARYEELGWTRGGKSKAELRDYSHVWNKELTKDTDARLQAMSARISEINKNMPQHTRDKISKSVILLWKDDKYRAQQLSHRQGKPAWNKGLVGVYHWTEEQREKHNATKRKNKTFNTSKSEEAYYNYLVDTYGKDDIIRQYRDKERYPFHCDFYIISLDKFIELNSHWTHGTEPYDETNPKHIELKNFLIEKSKTSDFYSVALRVWTETDVKKRKIALENNLNYEVIYGQFNYKGRS